MGINNEDLALRITGDGTGGARAAREVAAELKAAQKDVDNIKAAFEGLGVASHQVFEQELSKATGRVTALQAELKGIPPKVEETKKSFESLTTALTAAGTAMHSAGRVLTTAITAPLVAFAASSLKASIDFETAFAGVRKTVTGTPAELEKLNHQFREMALTTPVSAVGLAQIGEQAGQLGVQKENIAAFTKTIVDISSATHLTADEAGTAFAKLANVMKMPQAEFSNLGSAVVALGNFGASTEQEMLAMGQRISAAGATAGMTVPQVLGIANALASVGINAEAGGTAISRAIIKMTHDVATGSGHLDDFARTSGMTAKQFQTAWHDDAGTAFSAFMQGLAHVRERGGDQLVLLMDELGFKEIRMRNAFMSAANAGDLMRDSIALGTKAFAENTEIVRASEERYKTAANQLKIFWNNVTDVGITLGNALVPILLDVVRIVRDDVLPVMKRLSDWFSGLSPTGKDAVVAIGLMAAALGPTLYVGGSLALALSNVIKLMQTLAGVEAFGAVTAGAPAVITALRGIMTAIGESKVAMAGLSAGLWGLGIGGMYVVASALGDQFKAQLEATAAARATEGTRIQPGTGKTLTPQQIRDALAAAPALTDGFSMTVPGLAGPAPSKAPGGLPTLGGDDAKLKKMTVGEWNYELEQLGAKNAPGVSPVPYGPFENLVPQVRSAMARFGPGIIGGIDETGLHSGIRQIAGLPAFLANPLSLGVLDEKTGLTHGAYAGIGTGPVDIKGAARANILAMQTHPYADLAATIPATLARAFTGGGGLGGAAQAIGSQVGSTAMANIFGAGNGAKGLLSGLTGTLGSTLGAAMPVIGSLIGPAIQGLAHLFSTAGRDQVQGFMGDQGGSATVHAELLSGGGAEGEALWKQLTQGVGRGDAKAAQAAIQNVTTALQGYRQALAQAATEETTVAARMQTIQAITPDLQAALDRAFNAKNATDYRMALSEISGVLDQQDAKQQHLDQTLQKYNLDWLTTGDAVRQAHLDTIAQGLIADFTELKNAGVDIRTEMTAMSQPLSDFVQQARTAGVEVPESMRAIIQSAIDAGELFDKDGNKITDMSEMGLKFGTTMQETMKTVGDQIAHLADVLQQTLGGAFNTLATTATDALGRIPKNINIGVTSDYRFTGAETSDLLDGVPSFDQRPMERVVKPGLAMLHPGDLVGVPPAGWRGQSGSLEIVVPVHLDGRELARGTVRYLPDVLADHGLTAR